MFGAETKALFAKYLQKGKSQFSQALFASSFRLRLTNYLFWFLLQIIQFLGNSWWILHLIILSGFELTFQSCIRLYIIFWFHYEMRENNHGHSKATSVHSNKLTVSTKHFWGKKHLQGKSQLYELSLPWKSFFG